MADELKFTTELKLWKYEIERLAKKFGLSFHPIMYILVTPDEMSELAARRGFPSMPHHWRYGQESLWNKKQFRYGLGRIYEMVINTKPYYAYLLKLNDLITQKSVMAHVCGHADMFSSNAFFEPTKKKNMIIEFALDAMRLERLCELHGRDKVKKFYDDVLSFEYCVDMSLLYKKRGPQKSAEEREKERESKLIPPRIEPREPLPEYMDEFLNPKEWIEAEKERLKAELKKEIEIERGTIVPSQPTRDILGFLMQYAPLEQWQREIIAMVRRQTYYFLPQAATKFMHEGWATYWQEEIMTEAGLIDSSELSQFAIELANVQKRRVLSPYRLSYDLWHDIKERWDTGRHGSIWEDCNLQSIKNRWDEFIVWKTICDEYGYEREAWYPVWLEFSAFVQELKEGRLGFPKELFVRNFLTTKYLIPTWVRYTKLAEEIEKFSRMRQEMEPLELEARLLAANLMQNARTPIEMEEIRYKARRDVYASAGKAELWLWTLEEVKREERFLEKMRLFRERFLNGEINVDPIIVDAEWEEYAKQYEPVELGKGTEKIFEVRATYNDLLFFEDFFTREFCEKHRFFYYETKKNWDWQHQDEKEHYVLSSRDFERIKRRLLFHFINFNLPIIEAVDANFNDNGEAYLVHQHKGVDMDWWSRDQMYMKDVLMRFFRIWGGKKMVHLETIITDKEEERPWYYSWGSNQKETKKDKLTGTRVIFSYGLVDKTGNTEGFWRKDVEKVTFPPPF